MKRPNFIYERKFWKSGHRFVAGVDEVGRGCFAGPVVAAAVAFTPDIRNTIYEIREKDVKIDDSKKLTKLQKETAEKWIKENAVTWGIGEASAKLINRLGVAPATKVAFRRAVTNANRRINNKINYLLIDAFFIPYVRRFPHSRQLAIVKGDEKSFSIAAASIVAKVYRDSLMKKIGSRKNYKRYDWVNNYGYATKRQRDAILKYGITGYHRKSFVNTFLENQSAT